MVVNRAEVISVKSKNEFDSTLMRAVIKLLWGIGAVNLFIFSFFTLPTICAHVRDLKRYDFAMDHFLPQMSEYAQQNAKTFKEKDVGSGVWMGWPVALYDIPGTESYILQFDFGEAGPYYCRELWGFYYSPDSIAAGYQALGEGRTGEIHSSQGIQKIYWYRIEMRDGKG